MPIFSAGDFEGEGAETILFEDQRASSYRKLVLRDDRLVGAVLLGNTADALRYRDLIQRHQQIASIRSSIAFGWAYAEAA